jgi:cell pole-organizing protein PopZ
LPAPTIAFFSIRDRQACRGVEVAAGKSARESARNLQDNQEENLESEWGARMTQPAKSQEPTMEEILASIRRIIADDDASKSAQAPQAAPARTAVAPPPPPQPISPPRPTFVAPPAVAPEPPRNDIHHPETPVVAPAAAPVDDQSSDILDLTDSMAVAPPELPGAGPAPQFRKIDGRSDLSFEDAGERAAMQTMIDEARRSPSRELAGYEERNGLLSSDTSAAVDSAFNTLAQTVLVQNARTLEDLVREMLRPLLKAWLDDNLPGMVERLVRAEIERVSRGRAS